MENKTMCSICGEKEAKIVMMKHWQTGMVMPFVEGTCGHPECLKQYEEFMNAAAAQIESYALTETTEVSNEQA